MYIYLGYRVNKQVYKYCDVLLFIFYESYYEVEKTQID